MRREGAVVGGGGQGETPRSLGRLSGGRLPPRLRQPGPVTCRLGLLVGAVRWSEWVVVLFLVWTALVAWWRPTPAAVRYRVEGVNLGLILTAAVLIDRAGRRRSLALSVARDWLPLAIVVFAYQEMGWFAVPHAPALESRWVVWDRLILGGGAEAVIESAGPLLPGLLEIAYSLAYTLAPLALAILYLYRRQGRADRLLFVFCLAVLLCYAAFPFWPSEPPRAVFAGENVPAYDTVFRRFNWWMLGHAGIHTSVFPSAHVAGAFSSAFGLRLALPERRWASRLLFQLAVLIAVATVYGRYHYAADAAAGLGLALLAFAAGAVGERLAVRRGTVQWPRRWRHTGTEHRRADARGA